ncbi:MAG: twin-arginine translocase TatA/TatE family subunit, partial [Crenarchaeota archaeon]|nr:twin-arginine translocase TatA/TatE family subunit [Thermoproteota archaeon]
IAILLIWGPSKLPSLARAIGQAIHEFKRGTKGLVEEEEEKTVTESPKRESMNDKEKILEIAKRLGIDTTGKSLDEIIAEIDKKLSQAQVSK